MPIKQTCPQCRVALSIPDRLAGTSQRCPRCATPITVVPTISPAPEPVARPARRPPAAALAALGLLLASPVLLVAYCLIPSGLPAAADRAGAAQGARDEEIQRLAARLKQKDPAARAALLAIVDSDDELAARTALRELCYHLKPADLSRLADRLARAGARDLKNQIVTCTLQFKDHPLALRIYQLAGADADREVRRQFYGKIAPLANFRYRAIQRLVEQSMAVEPSQELRERFKGLR